MERTLGKPTVRLLAFGALVTFALAFTLAVATAPQAHAADQANDLQAAQLEAQTVPSNTTKNKAAILELGATKSTRFFEYEEHSHSNLADYWYKFKTSKRTSAYALKLVSVDNSMMWATCYDAHMNEFDWDGADGTIVDSTLGYLTDLPKNQWVYFKFSVTKTAQDYNKRFRITVTEYNPILEYVEGVKATKKTANAITLKWKKQASNARYQVQYRVKGGKWKVKTVSKNTVKLTGLKKNAQYQVRVRACAKTGKGFYLDEHKPAKCTDWTSILKVKTAKK